MTTTREAKAGEILKAHRAAAKVTKARALSPAFDAECRAAERPVGFWQWAGYVHGRLRLRGWLALGSIAVIAYFLWPLFVLAAQVLVLRPRLAADLASHTFAPPSLSLPRLIAHFTKNP